MLLGGQVILTFWASSSGWWTYNLEDWDLAGIPSFQDWHIMGAPWLLMD